MFVTPEGDRLLVIDGHVHFWDARPENRRNRYGLTFIESFWGSHRGLTPPDQRWDFERFLYYGVEGAAKDLFEDGYVDIAVMLPPICTISMSTDSTRPSNARSSRTPIRTR